MNYQQITTASGHPKIDPEFGNRMIARKRRLQNDVFAKGDEGIASMIMAFILHGVTRENAIRTSLTEMVGFHFSDAVERVLNERDGVSWYRDECGDYMPVL